MIVEIGLHKKRPNIPTPSYATDQAACMDVTYEPSFDARGNPLPIKGYSLDNSEFERPLGENNCAILAPGDRLLVPTGLRFDIPEGFSIRVYSRSGNALKKGMTPANAVGIIDSDYVDELFVIMYNMTQNRLVIQPGDRIGQVELVRNLGFEFADRAEAPKRRGRRKGGLGSTGE